MKDDKRLETRRKLSNRSHRECLTDSEREIRSVSESNAPFETQGRAAKRPSSADGVEAVHEATDFVMLSILSLCNIVRWIQLLPQSRSCNRLHIHDQLVADFPLESSHDPYHTRIARCRVAFHPSLLMDNGKGVPPARDCTSKPLVSPEPNVGYRRCTVA